MATNEYWAKRIILAYAELRQSSEQVFVSYGEMAELIGRKGEHRLLGAPLDLVRAICEQANLPDVATVVVDQKSLRSGEMKPSPKAMDKHSGWPGLRSEQGRVLAYNWSAVETENVIA
ncbi:hypothetical protein [Leisingera sp. ANG-Vp]|uniref:hypothetical protein n=1 Tax=Leisingera sp. ANG-Vp TaxID=1577896 RepID=UPI00057EF16C|nr:hypothetical protein [Leisingera sp. ANG-Vp]KIC13809.1 hypothetical protein RA20_22290 [Leisingera sp. ANG-Vp]